LNETFKGRSDVPMAATVKELVADEIERCGGGGGASEETRGYESGRLGKRG
jgi:hypothetical protein